MFHSGVPGSLCVLLTCCLCCVHAVPTPRSRDALNDRPVIGILTQQVSDEVMKPYGKTFIPAAYVKYVESGGSRVMPIRLTLSTAEYERIFKKINGLLFIGGAVDLEKSQYARVAKIFFKLALTGNVLYKGLKLTVNVPFGGPLSANSAGDVFPIWGTCMGLQLLTVLVAGKSLLTNATAMNITMPLNLTTDAYSSRMFEDFSPELMKALAQEPLTGNFHHYGVTVKDFEENQKLQSFFSILSSNMAENEVQFVSTIEGRTYPFYGVQWHPEVIRFQWSTKMNFPHSPHAAEVSSRLAVFFVNEGRRSLHRFDDPEEEAGSLIYNYTPMFAGNFTGYEQIYFF